MQICYGAVCKYDWRVIGVNLSRSIFSELQLEIVRREKVHRREQRAKAQLESISARFSMQRRVQATTVD